MGSSIVQASLTYDDGISALYQANLTAKCAPGWAGTHLLGIEAVSAGGSYKQSWQSAPSNAVAAYQVVPINVEAAVTGPDLLKKFGICAWVLRKSNGTGAAISDAEIAQDIQYANDFWNEYGFGFELAKKMYIDNNIYYNLDPYDAVNLHAWKHDSTGLINLYYVNSIVGMGGAFCVIGCEFIETKAKDTYIIFDANGNTGWEEVLSHELGHNIGMLEDMYWLYWGYTCDYLAYVYCGYYDTAVYCNPPDAVYGNLMYFLNEYPWTPAWWYHISSNDIEMSTPAINSQGENAAYFHTNYPGNFLNMD